MRVLHLVKTSEGAAWAAQQAAVLVRHGVQVGAAIPDLRGRTVALWRDSGAQLLQAVCDFPTKAPWRLPQRLAGLRRLVAGFAPDVIHSHFVGTTLTMRYALRRDSPVRVFQVPGPLHLEHFAPRRWELSTAGTPDYWIASSRYIGRLYGVAGVPAERVFLSYYGTRLRDISSLRIPGTRARFGIPERAFVVGNISYMYPPRRYLGQRTGLKGHELVIDAIGLAAREVPELVGVLAGGEWGGGHSYERRLREYARSRAPGRILMPGHLGAEDVRTLWPEFDLVVHSPLSENCGGVHEAMLAERPVLVAPVGGLPELVIDGVTGRCAGRRHPQDLAARIVEAVAEPERSREMALAGAARVRELFDVERTAAEVLDIYGRIVRRSVSLRDRGSSI